MAKPIQSAIRSFLNGLYKENQGILVVTLQHEMVCYNELFKDIWEISEKALRSRNEMTGLKEAMRKVEGSRNFYEYVMHMYVSSELEKNTIQFKNGLSTESTPYFIALGEDKFIAWGVTMSPNQENKIKALCQLTPREKQVLHYYLFGFTAKMVANKLSIKARTAESYIENIKEKFNCYHRDDLISMAKLLGLIHVDLPDSVIFL